MQYACSRIRRQLHLCLRRVWRKWANRFNWAVWCDEWLLDSPPRQVPTICWSRNRDLNLQQRGSHSWWPRQQRWNKRCHDSEPWDSLVREASTNALCAIPTLCLILQQQYLCVWWCGQLLLPENECDRLLMASSRFVSGVHQLQSLDFLLFSSLMTDEWKDHYCG